MKLLITGGSGFIGSRFIELTHKNFEIYSLDRSDLPESIRDYAQSFKTDITQFDQVAAVIKEISPDWIFHLAAVTDVEGCEVNPKIRDLAWKVNVEGTKNIVEAAKATSGGTSRLLYTSTDFVFDGKKGPYSEEDRTNPVTEYGRTKLTGEKVAQASGLKYLIVRTAYPYRASFPNKVDVIRWLIGELQENRPFELVTDQYITPTFIDDFVRAVSVLINENAEGIYNAVGPERLNFYEMGLKVAEVFDFDKSLIRGTTLSELVKRLGRKAQQPREGGLKIDKLLSSFGEQIKLHSFEGSLEEIRRQIRVSPLAAPY